MNRFLSRGGSLVSLIVLLILVIVIVLSLRSPDSSFSPSEYPIAQSIPTSTQPTPYPGPSLTQLPAQEGNQAPALPLTPVFEEVIGDTGQPNSSSNPDSNNGFQLADLQEVIVQDGDAVIKALSEIDIDDNTLVGKAVLENGVAVVKIDSQTGVSEILSPATSQGIEAVTISGNYVAWIEALSSEGSFSTQLIVFDLVQGTQVIIAKGLPRHPDMKDNLLTWQEYRHNRWVINGYDLIREQELIIAGGPGIFSWPRICSGEWVIYMHYSDSPEAREVGTSDLFAHNLFTDETILIGQVPLSQSPATGRSHDCDGNRVAWASWSWDIQTNQPVAQQHLYDLTTRTERLLNIPVEGWGIRVRIAGDILLSTVGYDLSRDVAFSPFANVPLEQTKGSGGAMISGNRLAWIARPGDAVEGPWHLYTAAIIRDN